MIIRSVPSPASESAGAPTSDGSLFTPARLERSKRAYTTRRVDLSLARKLVSRGLRPAPGDLLLAKVIRLGQHTGLQLAAGRRATLFPGDEILVCYGNRYAPDQFEALVPDHLGPCHLVASGGVAANARCWHSRMRRPTEIEPLGLVVDSDGNPLNVSAFRLPEEASIVGTQARVIAVVGTSMNSGKTTSAAHLIRGLAAAGFRVGAAKVTGTGASGDVHLLADAGASPVVDFTDFGFASTYRVPVIDLERMLREAISYLTHAGAEKIVIEIADGLYQEETAALLKSATFRRQISGIIFAASDAMGAASGMEWLEQRGLPVLAVTGCLTSSPLAMEEAARATALPVLGLQDLADAGHALALIDDLQARLAVSTEA